MLKKVSKLRGNIFLCENMLEEQYLYKIEDLKHKTNKIGVFTYPYIWPENKVKKQCLNKNVLINNGKGILNLTFPNTEVLIVNNSSKFFCFNNLYIYRFPSLKAIYTNTPPYDLMSFHRFADKSDFTYFITDKYYNKYLNRWWYKDTKYIKNINEDAYKNVISMFEQVNPTIE